jgi:ADP-heptose:LPS heptosyltransferase
MQKLISKNEIKRILVINLGGIGDILLSLPALRSLRNFYNKAHITIWIVPRTMDLLKDLRYCDKLLTYDISVQERRGMGTWFNFKKIGEILSFLFLLRKKRFDMIINMRPLISYTSALKMALIMYIIGSKYRIGRDTESRSFFLTHKTYETYISPVHEIDHQLNIVKILGADIANHDLEINISEEDMSFSRDFLIREGIRDPDLVIGMNPGAAWPAKRWPRENFAELIDKLSKDLNCRIVITGSADELDIARELSHMTEAKISIAAGKTTIGQLAALIKRFNLYITNDTGSMHIAASLGVPIVAIFRPGHLKRNRPYMENDKFIVLAKNVACGPCQLVECDSLRCLKMILPEEVLKACYVLGERFSQRRLNYV